MAKSFLITDKVHFSEESLDLKVDGKYYTVNYGIDHCRPENKPCQKCGKPGVNEQFVEFIFHEIVTSDYTIVKARSEIGSKICAQLIKAESWVVCENCPPPTDDEIAYCLERFGEGAAPTVVC